jgi:hypothetical protein
MSECQFCGKETKNPKFCSKSCQIKKRNRDNNPMSNPKTVEKMIASVTGMKKKPRCQEANEKISKSLTGRKLSQEHINNTKLGVQKYYKEHPFIIPIERNVLEKIVSESGSFYEVSKKLNINKTTINQWIIKLGIDFSHFRFLNREDKTDFQKYKQQVWQITNKFRKKLFDIWNGKCYYTGKCLNKKDKKLISTIDHKISIRFGFDNKINPTIIGDFSNLCICARWYNSFKHCRTELQQIVYHSNHLI